MVPQPDPAADRATSAAPSPPADPSAAATGGASPLASLQRGLARLAEENAVLAAQVEELSLLNRQAAAELTRAREEQARAALQAAARAEASLVTLKELQGRLGAVAGQLLEVQGAVQQSTARNAELTELAHRTQDETGELVRERTAALTRAEASAAELQKMRAEREELRRELAALETGRNELLGRIEDLQQVGAERESELQGLRQRLTAAQAESVLPSQQALPPQAKQELPEPLNRKAEAQPQPAPQPEGRPQEGATVRAAEQQASGAGAGATAPPCPEAVAPGRATATLPASQPEPAREEETAAEPAEAEAPETPAILSNFPPIPEGSEPHAAPALAAHQFPSFSGLGDDAFFGSTDPDELPLFVLQPALEAIEYLAPEDVVSLYQPVNVAHLSLDGKGPEICQGYICYIRNEEKRQVYAAIRGQKSGRVRVYVPEEPVGEDAVDRAIRGAIAFGEQVGLLMEEKSEGSPQRHRDSVLACPVLRSTGKGDTKATRAA